MEQPYTIRPFLSTATRKGPSDGDKTKQSLKPYDLIILESERFAPYNPASFNKKATLIIIHKILFDKEKHQHFLLLGPYY